VLIPATIRLFAVHQIPPGELLGLTQMAMQLQARDKAEIDKITQLLEGLVPEVDIMLVRVESWFDDAFEE